MFFWGFFLSQFSEKSSCVQWSSVISTGMKWDYDHFPVNGILTSFPSNINTQHSLIGLRKLKYEENMANLMANYEFLPLLFAVQIKGPIEIEALSWGPKDLPERWWYPGKHRCTKQKIKAKCFEFLFYILFKFLLHKWFYLLFCLLFISHGLSPFATIISWLILLNKYLKCHFTSKTYRAFTSQKVKRNIQIRCYCWLYWLALTC